MYEAYIARLQGGRVYGFFHSADNGVCLRVYENGRWGRSMALAVDARPNFTVNQCQDGFYVLYQDREGRIRHVFCHDGTDGGQDALPALPDITGDPNILHLLASGRGFRLLYEAVTEDGRRILSRTFTNGRWGTEEDLGSHVPGPGFEYVRLQRINDDHYILFSQEKQSEGSVALGYRELNLDRAGEFRPAHIGASPASGCSLVTTADAIHFLYIVRSVFSSRLVYRKRQASGLTAAVTVCEGVRLDECLLFIARDRLHACYLSGGALYICGSDDDGLSFRRPQRYRGKFCESPVKAAFLSDEAPREAELAAREVWVDSHNPWDVQLAPDIYEDFYPLPPAVQAVSKPETPPAPTVFPSVPTNDVAMDEETAFFNNAGLEMLKREVQTQKAVIEKLYREKEDLEKRFNSRNNN